MAENTIKDLNYGYPGAVTYDLGNKQWSFSRQHRTKQLKQVRTWNGDDLASTVALPASVRFSTLTTPVNSTSVQQDARIIALDHAQLAPASALLPELSLLSAAIQNTASTYDPLVGNLLSFGSITREDRHEDPRRIAAIPTGEAGNILKLAIMNKERHGWARDKSIWVEGPTLKLAGCGYWNEEAAPIQQVCFAQSEDRSSLLAVRLPTKTVLLRPMYYRRARDAGSSPFYHLPASTIDAHPILTIEVDRTGGSPHADVSFNPDFQFQFAIVDKNHNWSVWDIEHGRKGDSYTKSCLAHGPLNPPESDATTGEDGWSRILWIGDVNTILICSRRVLSIVSLKGGSFEYLPSPTLISAKSIDWILDVKRHPRSRGRFFILTSTYLILLSVITASEALDATTGDMGASIIASWRHYRDVEDFTLNFSAQATSNDECLVILHSRLNPLIQAYTFRDLSSGSSAPIVASDPIMWDLGLDHSANVAQLHIESMEYGETRQENIVPGPGHSYLDKAVEFYQVFALRSDLSVHELVFYTSGHGENDSGTIVENFARNRVRHPRRDISSKDVVEEWADFLVPNGLDEVDEPKSRIASQAPRWTQSWGRSSLQSGRDYQLLYDALTLPEKGREDGSESIDISVVTAQVKQMLLDDLDAPSTPIGTLFDFAGMKIAVFDVDEASLRMEELSSPEERAESGQIQRIASAGVLRLAEVEAPTIADLYDTVLHHWVAPLPKDVSIRVRQHKERLARRVAAEVILASSRIRNHEPQDSAAESQRGLHQDSGVALPILPAKLKESAYGAASLWPLSQPLPTILHSSISSSMPVSSSPPSAFSPPAPVDPIARLGRHLLIRSTSITPAIVPSNVNHLLAHWKPGTDPRTYDWAATEDALRPENHDEVTQKQYEKERRRRERRNKRQQREDMLMRVNSSSQPVVWMENQVGAMSDGVASSSQVPSQAHTQIPLSGPSFRGPGGMDILAPMSQVEPGRFGGRLDSKKKKKGRVSGF